MPSSVFLNYCRLQLLNLLNLPLLWKSKQNNYLWKCLIYCLRHLGLFRVQFCSVACYCQYLLYQGLSSTWKWAVREGKRLHSQWGRDSLIVLGTDNIILTCLVFIRKRKVLCNNAVLKNKENLPFELVTVRLNTLPVPSSQTVIFLFCRYIQVPIHQMLYRYEGDWWI